ncbi:hypothetical protein TRAPUB_2233 [Trametes pubescens]|uniref:Uncharacterized protein n=1 Tax=Trametes pubescens TaxID=154538 RepID=A0A1M2VHC7_TRAPU|nr:hypothetical protein TRAPUB_2233 [Trametes pubescens]
MATRQNKKRKGRPNAPPRERTVTTLTDGPEGSFMPSPLPDYEDSPTAALLSPPFSVPTPLSAATPAALAAGPFPLSPFSASFPYNNFVMSPLAGPPFQSQHPPPQFFAPQQPQSIPQPLPAQHVLPPGKNDLEILERLKQTIKNNQHELFRPVPQPAALANVYLGPKSTLVSQVAPHPEQLPSDPSPPGLTLLSHDTTTKDGANVSTANILNQSTARLPSQSPHARDGAKKPPHRSSISESPKNNVLPTFLPPLVHYSPILYLFQAMPPPSKRTSTRFDPVENKPVSTAKYSGNARYDPDSSPRMGPPGLQRLDQASTTRSGPGKPVRNEIVESPIAFGEPSPAKLPIANGKDDSRPRDSMWSSRNNSMDDRQQRTEPDKGRPVSQSPRMGNTSVPGLGNGNDARELPSRDIRNVDRDRDSQRDRDNQRDKDKDFDRDRGRPAREEPNRFRDDRRNDDRPRPSDTRRPSPDSRRYEPRYPPRRYDSKASDNSVVSPRLADKSPPGPRPPRNLGEERAIIRPPADPSVPRTPLLDERRVPPTPLAVEERNAKPPPSFVDERRLPVSIPGPDRQIKANDDRRLPPLGDRLQRPEDKRPLPSAASERPGPPADDRRRPLSPSAGDRYGRSSDDRRVPPPPPAASAVDRRPVDDRRPPPSVDRYVPAPTVDDRRPPVSAVADRPPRPEAENRRPPSLEERISRAPVAVLPDSVPARPMLEARGSRPAQTDDRSPRPPVPLEERISRAPSLHERLNQPPVRQDDRPVPRLEDRISRPANAPPSLEERLSTPVVPDERLRPRSRSRPPRPIPASSDRPPVRSADDRSAPTAPPADRPALRPEDRVFTPAERFTRAVTPAGSDRGHPPPARSYGAPSVARDEPRTFRPSSPGRSPVRSDVREFRPAGEPRDGLSYRRNPVPEQERYTSERRPAPVPAPAPAPEPMDVDLHPRSTESRLSYRRPEPPPAETYPARDRAWVPAGEAYREPEPTRRPAADPAPAPHSYTREWREGERPYGDDYSERSWDRGREYDRDARFVERDAVPPVWETREERERRAAYPAADVPPPPPASRSYDRPLSARLSDAHPDDRAYLDRGRYTVEPPAASYSRVRPRSPSPLRRGAGSDDMRAPPPKRARDDAYYYPDERAAEYAPPPPRMRTPPPPSSVYYDEPRYPSPARDREYIDARERDVGGYVPYDRRADAARLPPRRSPPPYAYGRDDRRY